MKQKKIKRKFKLTDSKSWVFQFRLFSIFFRESSGNGPCVIRINWWKGHQCGSTCMVIRLSTVTSKTSKNAFFVFLACFRAYVGQPDDHIATSMPFPSIFPSHQSLKFSLKNIENWRNWKTQFFWVSHFEFFCFIPMKISQSFLGSKDGSKEQGA